ncbi:MAG: hypothetical protein BWY87_00985 [Deltaproteobacteria bacterium ADurb.Bin510]|nr:MAG: hypothetical protein BWY87_00985 [Deltaproteobacteria bacterium ADurb.Bin510]
MTPLLTSTMKKLKTTSMTVAKSCMTVWRGGWMNTLGRRCIYSLPPQLSSRSLGAR